MSKFEAGKIYQGRSVCDADCIIKLEVVARTAKFLTTAEGKRLGIKTRDGVEYVMPWGMYSMAPSVSADKVVGSKVPHLKGHPNIPFSPQIQRSIDAARKDLAARLQSSDVKRCVESLDKMQHALNEGEPDGIRYFWMAAQAIAQTIPPAKHAGVVIP